MKKTVVLIFCALFAALTAVCSQIAIPMVPVPVNLAMLSVFVAGGFLGPKYGALSQFVYVALGAVGVPVFSSFRGGFGVLVGPTGGYIIGYIVAAFVTGLIIQQFNARLSIIVAAMITGLLVCYTLGTAWFMFSTNNGLVQSLMLCVVPFLVGDALKIAVATTLVHRLRIVMTKRGEFQIA